MEKTKMVYFIQSVATGKKLLLDNEAERVFWVETNEFTEFSTEKSAWTYLEKWYTNSEVYQDFEVIEVPIGISTDRNAL